MKYLAIAMAASLLAAPAFAQMDVSGLQGDPAAGEEQFGRQCVACHVVVNEEGETLAGRNAQTGPNQYGLPYRVMGSQEDFRYSDALVALGEEGRLWTQEDFVGYVQDPTGWLREATGDDRARGKMAYMVRSEEEAYDLFAYLASVGPELEGDAAAAMEEDAGAATN